MSLDVEYDKPEHSRRHRAAPVYTTCNECDAFYDTGDAGHEKRWLGDMVYEFDRVCPVCGTKTLHGVSKEHAFLRLVVRK